MLKISNNERLITNVISLEMTLVKTLFYKTSLYLCLHIILAYLCFDIIYTDGGSSVAEWLGRRTLNPEVTGLSPVLATKLELFLSGP